MLSKVFLSQAVSQIQAVSRSVRDSAALLSDPPLPGAKDINRWWPETQPTASPRLLVPPKPPSSPRIAGSSGGSRSARSASERPSGPEPERKPFRRPASARGVEGNGESLALASRGVGAKTVPRLTSSGAPAAFADKGGVKGSAADGGAATDGAPTSADAARGGAAGGGGGGGGGGGRGVCPPPRRR